MARELAFDPSILADWAMGFDDLDEDPLDPWPESVRDLVEKLPADQRAVVELIAWGQMGKSKVARELGYSRSHVHDLWNEAKETLHAELSAFLH